MSLVICPSSVRNSASWPVTRKLRSLVCIMKRDTAVELESSFQVIPRNIISRWTVGIGFRFRLTGGFGIVWGGPVLETSFYITLSLFWSSPHLWLQLWFFLNEPLFIGFTYVITDKAAVKFHFFLRLFSSFLLFRCPLGPRFNTRELDFTVVYVSRVRFLFLMGRAQLERSSVKWHKRDWRTDRPTRMLLYVQAKLYLVYCCILYNRTWPNLMLY